MNNDLFRGIHGLIERYDRRRKPTVTLGQTQAACNPREWVRVSLDAKGPSGTADEVPALNATGFFIGAGVRVQVRYDRPARAVIEGVVGQSAADDRNAWEPTWTVLAGTAPSIGDGELLGRFQIINGRFFFEIGLIGGPTTVWGSAGNRWLFGLPHGILPARPTAGSLLNTEGAIVTWLAVDSSAGTGATARYHGFGEVDANALITLDTISATVASQSAAFVSNAAPMTWEDPDTLLVAGNFPLAGA